MTTLVLGLGNDLLSDDGFGLAAARALRPEFQGRDDVEVVESSLAGLALLDLLIGYDRAIIIDGIRTGRVPAGTLIELTADDLDRVIAPSPHYAGLPELLAVAHGLDLAFPRDVRILAMETEDSHTIGEGLSGPVRRALPEAVARVRELIQADVAAGPVTEVDHA